MSTRPTIGKSSGDASINRISYLRKTNAEEEEEEEEVCGWNDTSDERNQRINDKEWETIKKRRNCGDNTIVK